MGGNLTRQELDDLHESRNNDNAVGKAPWVYRMCSTLENSDIKGLINFVLVGGLCAFGGHKLAANLKNNDLKTAFTIAEKANDKNGYVTFTQNGKTLVMNGDIGSKVVLEPQITKKSLTEAKHDIISAVEENHEFADYVAPGGLGLIGGVLGVVILGSLIESGDNANSGWEHKKRREAVCKTV
jgi:hypothetical protein